MSENIYKGLQHRNHTNIYEYASFMFKPQNVVIQEDTNLPILLTNDRPEGWRYLRQYEKSDWIKYKQSLKQQQSPSKKVDDGSNKKNEKGYLLQKQHDKQKDISKKSFHSIQKEKRILQGSQEKQKYSLINKRALLQDRVRQKIEEKYQIPQKMPQIQSPQKLKEISKQLQSIKDLLSKRQYSKKEFCQECVSRRNKKEELLDKLQLQQTKSMRLLQQNIFLKETIKQLTSNRDYLQLYMKQMKQNSNSKYFNLILQQLKDLKRNKESKIFESNILSEQVSFRQKNQEDNAINQRLTKKAEELEYKNLRLESQINQLIVQIRNKDNFILKQQQQIEILKSANNNGSEYRSMARQIYNQPIFYSRMTFSKNISGFIQKHVSSITKRQISKAILLYQKDKFNTNIFNYFDRQPFPVLILFQSLNNVIFGAFAEGTQTYLTNRRNLEEEKSFKFKAFLFNASQQIVFHEDENNIKGVGLSFTQNHLRFGNNELYLKNNSLDKITVPGNSIFGQKYFKSLNRKSLTGQAGDIIQIKGLQIHQLQFEQQ